MNQGYKHAMEFDYIGSCGAAATRIAPGVVGAAAARILSGVVGAVVVIRSRGIGDWVGSRLWERAEMVIVTAGHCQL
ncbi:uncharacterized protein A4U43_C08F18440 [Asparagus officinalis]|nr:uncharacterized protein A4U43_C08F18440 [Asparagus officinalis]